MIPETLDDWTLPRLRELLAGGAFENDRLEWKEQLPRDDVGKQRVRLAMAAFANASGGFLLFGVKDDPTAPAPERLVGVSQKLELVHELAAIAKRCEPWIEHSAKNPPLVLEGERVVHVVHVPASSRRPHGVVVDEAWRFPIRVSGGHRLMTWEELRDTFTDIRRRHRLLGFLRVEINRLRELGESVNRLAHNWRDGFRPQAVREFGRSFDSSQLERVLVEVADEIARDPALLLDMNLVRELAKEWDTGAVEFAARARMHDLTEADIVDRGRVAADFGFRVSHATHGALRGINDALGRPS